MVFVFGLPGCLSSRQQHGVPSLLAARKVLAVLTGAGLSGAAGIDAGPACCGLLGHPRLRCWYSLIGGAASNHPVLLFWN